MRKKLTRYLSLTLCFLFFFMIGVSAVRAAGKTDNLDPFGLKGAVSGTGVSESTLNGPNNIISMIIFNILGAVGIIFLILMIWGGIQWMTSGGNEQRVSKAKSILTTATIGLVIIMMAYSITYFVIDNLTQAGEKPSGQCDPTKDPNC